MTNALLVTPHYNEKSIVLSYETKLKNFNMECVTEEKDRRGLSEIETIYQKYGEYILSLNYSDLIKKRFLYKEKKNIHYQKTQVKNYVFDIIEEFTIIERKDLLFLEYYSEDYSEENFEIKREYEDIVGVIEIILTSIRESFSNLLKNLSIEKIFNLKIPPYKYMAPEYIEHDYTNRGYYKYKGIQMPHGTKKTIALKKGMELFQEEFRTYIIEVCKHEEEYKQEFFDICEKERQRVISILGELFSATQNEYDYDTYIEKHAHHLLDICERASVKDLLSPTKNTKYNSEIIKRIDGMNVAIPCI